MTDKRYYLWYQDRTSGTNRKSLGMQHCWGNDEGPKLLTKARALEIAYNLTNHQDQRCEIVPEDATQKPFQIERT